MVIINVIHNNKHLKKIIISFLLRLNCHKYIRFPQPATWQQQKVRGISQECAAAVAALIALNWQYPGAREARLAKPCDLQKSVDELRKASAAAFFVRPRCRNAGPSLESLY